MSIEEIIKKLKLTSSISTSNMHVFDSNCKIKKMSCVQEIIYHFYRVRKEHYITRKKYLVDKMNADFLLMDSKIKFIRLVVESKIIIFNKKKDFIIKQINEHSLLKVNGNYDYLLDMKIHSLTLEKIKELESKMETINIELDTLKSTSIESMWISELLTLEF
jgi:DNA topoisomerase-2